MDGWFLLRECKSLTAPGRGWAMPMDWSEGRDHEVGLEEMMRRDVYIILNVNGHSDGVLQGLQIEGAYWSTYLL